MGQWFGRKGRGTVMGFWTTNYVIGGLVAGPIAAYFLRRHGWRGAFLYPAIAVGVVGLLVLFFLPERRTAPDAAAVRASADERHAERRAARRQVLANPLIWALGCSYFFLKLLRYVMLFWLVYYGEKVLHLSNWVATNVALAFEVGGALGAITIGWLSERWFAGRRIPASVLSLVVLAAATALYGQAAAHGLVANVIVLGLVGFFLFGPDALVSATAAQDAGGPAGAATAAGVINGMGSVGPILGSEVANWLTDRYGWSTFYVILGAGAVVSALILVPFWRTRR